MAVRSAAIAPAVAPAPAKVWLALTRMELRMGWRTTAFRVASLVALLFGYANGEAPGAGVGLSAYGTGEAAWRYLGMVAVFWMSLAAVRETTMRTDVLISSKPQPNERLALTKFVGAFAQVEMILASMFLGAILGRVFTGGSLLGFPVYLLQFVRVTGILFFASATSFSLALLFDSPIAGSLISLYWIMTLAAKPFLAKFYFPSYTQNIPSFVALGAALLCLVFWLHRRKRRGATPPALWVRIGALLLLFLTATGFRSVIVYGHDPQAIRHPVMDQITQQDADLGTHAPGFLLPDQHGNVLGLTDFEGKILVIALWSPHDPDSVLLLDRLNQMQATYGSRGVQPIAVCLGEDTGAAATFGIGEAARYPVLEDWGTYNAPVRSEISPVANAYRTSLPPKLFVTDRRRTIKAILAGSECYEGPALETDIRQRLEAEPR